LFWTDLPIIITPISEAAFTAVRDSPMPSPRRFLPPWTIEEQEAPRFALAYFSGTTQWPTAAATGFCFAPWSKVWAKPFAAMISRPPSAIGEGSVWPPNRLLPMIQSEMHLEGCF
jgi:hypothetical protein